MVQGAIYDAVNAIDRGHQPYSGPVRASTARRPRGAQARTTSWSICGDDAAAGHRRVDLLAEPVRFALIDPVRPRTTAARSAPRGRPTMVGAEHRRADSMSNRGRWAPSGQWRGSGVSNNVFGQFATSPRSR
jgi:hypothetical protein